MRVTFFLPALFELAFRLPASAAAPPADAGLGWLAGAWCGTAQGDAIEETWLRPVDGQLIGMSRTVRGKRAVGHEFMRIAPVEGVPTFFAQPGGKPPTAFPAVEAGAQRIRFANAHHDFPQWVEYRREGELLLARIGGPGENGKPFEIDFRYAPCTPPAQ